jgi:hypothetical protein
MTKFDKETEVDYIEIIKFYTGEIQYHKSQIEDCLEQIKVLEPEYQFRDYSVGGINLEKDDWKVIGDEDYDYGEDGND